MAKGRGMGLSLIWLKKFEKPPEADKTGEFGVVGIQDLFEGKTPFGLIICPGPERLRKKWFLAGERETELEGLLVRTHVSENACTPTSSPFPSNVRFFPSICILQKRRMGQQFFPYPRYKNAGQIAFKRFAPQYETCAHLRVGGLRLPASCQTAARAAGSALAQTGGFSRRAAFMNPGGRRG